MARQPNLDRSILEVALTALESRRAELDALIGSVRRQLGGEVSSSRELSAKQAAPRKGRKRVMSAEARARIAEAQRKRWAAARKQVAAPAKTKRVAQKRTMSPEARERIAEAQRKRWAAARKSA